MKGTDRQAIAFCRQAPSETTNREVFSRLGGLLAFPSGKHIHKTT